MDQLDIGVMNANRAGIGQTEMRLNHLRSPGADNDPKRLKEAAQEIERYFIHVLMREMRKMTPPDPLVGGGKAEEIFRDFMDEEIAGEMARSGQLGLADLIFDSLQNLLKQESGNADIYS
jgi:flagellar protein FlgJ